jgi:Ca2+-binding RTX toxin-like protein
MRRVALLLTVMAAALVLASGVALAVTKVGTNGHDVLKGTDGKDSLLGLGGQDDIFGKGGSDNLLGGPGKDNVLGGDERRPGGGDKNLAGGSGNDLVLGGKGSDNIVGEDGNDLAFGASGADKILGGDGNDVLLGVLFRVNAPADRDVVSCGDGFDRVLADRKDTVARDCEKVFVGLDSEEKFFESIPRSFFRGLPPSPFR